MKIAGIILIVLQALGIISSFISGQNPFAHGSAFMLGYFLCGFIGIGLLIGAASKKKKQKRSQAAAEAESVKQKQAPDVKSDHASISKSVDEWQDEEQKTSGYHMDEALKAKFTRMFRQPFSQVVNEEEFTVKQKKCVVYYFRISYATSAVGAFLQMIEVKGNSPR